MYRILILPDIRPLGLVGYPAWSDTGYPVTFVTLGAPRVSFSSSGIGSKIGTAIVQNFSDSPTSFTDLFHSPTRTLNNARSLYFA